MKKILSLVVLVAAVAMVSCIGNNNKKSNACEPAACEQCCEQSCEKPAECAGCPCEAAPEAAPAEVAPEAPAAE